jgi:hypothetical protein
MARESKLSGLSDNELRALGTKGVAAKFYNGNVGAAWNALFNPKTGRLANDKQDSPATTKTAQPATVKQPAVKATGEFVGPPIERFLPGRIELLLEMLGHDVHLTGVLNAIEENSVAWCTQIRKMGDDERALMRDYTGMTAWTIADIDHEKREEKRMLPFVVSKATVSTHQAIDETLRQKRDRFEMLRYDADLTAFYCAD